MGCDNADMTENQAPHDSRREPSDWEEVVGKEIVTEGDKAQLQEYLEAVRRAQQSETPSGPEQARAALEAAKLRQKTPSSSASQSDNPTHRLSDQTIETGKKGIADARDALHPPTEPTNPDSPEKQI